MTETEVTQAVENVADAIANGDAPATAETDATKQDPRIFIMVTMPKELFDKIDADAKLKGVGRATYARELLAEKYGYALPESGTTSRKKYDTDEEREAARKTANQSRQKLQAVLMIVHRMKMAALAKSQPIDEAAFTIKAEIEYDAKLAAKAEKLAKEEAEKKAAAEAAKPAEVAAAA